MSGIALSSMPAPVSVRAITVVFLITTLIALAACAPPPDIGIADARARVTLAGRDTTAGYVTIRNGTNANVRLTGASTGRMERIELHTHEHRGDVMRMVRLPHIDVPAGGEARLEPGGMHLMMFGVEPALTIGETFEVTFEFADGQTVTAPFEVVPIKQ